MHSQKTAYPLKREAFMLAFQPHRVQF